MKRPSGFTYVVGNPVSVIALALGAAYLAYQWWNGGSPAIALAAFIAAAYAMGANSRLQKYNDWKREWEAMEGKRPSQRTARRVLNSVAVRVAIGLPLWCAFAYLALTSGNDPTMRAARALFLLATLVMAVGFAYRLMRRRRPRANASRDVPVTLCVAPPRQSPDLAQAYAALPVYCRAILRK
jgi:hypothetical protein